MKSLYLQYFSCREHAVVNSFQKFSTLVFVKLTPSIVTCPCNALSVDHNCAATLTYSCGAAWHTLYRIRCVYQLYIQQLPGYLRGLPTSRSYFAIQAISKYEHGQLPTGKNHDWE